jgi:glutathione S-transferase
MLKLYFAPRTRSVRIVWLLEELKLPYELERVEFLPTSSEFFVQKTPLGKLPTLVDGDVVMCESGAIVEYILERYGDGRLAPPVGSPKRAAYLQWLHFAESTAFPPLGIVVWLTRYRDDAAGHERIIEDARSRAATGLEFLERQIGDNVMMGFTLTAARLLGVLDDRFPRVGAYLDRLQARPAFQKAASLE